jgi:hypothetical protein
MKNLFLLLITFSVLGALNGQTTKGTWVLGLHNFSPVPLTSEGLGYNLFPQTNAFGISFGTTKEKIDGELQEDKETSSIIGLSLNSHYFVADQLAIGLVGNFSTSSSTYKSDPEEYKSSATIFLVGPEVRYYFDSGTKTMFWLKGGASLGSVSTKYDGESGEPVNLSQFGGGAGLSIFPSSSVSIDIGLGYNVMTTSSKNNFTSGTYKTINSGLVADVGFGIFFGGGMKSPSPLPE